MFRRFDDGFELQDTRRNQSKPVGVGFALPLLALGRAGLGFAADTIVAPDFDGRVRDRLSGEGVQELQTGDTVLFQLAIDRKRKIRIPVQCAVTERRT